MIHRHSGRGPTLSSLDEEPIQRQETSDNTTGDVDVEDVPEDSFGSDIDPPAGDETTESETGEEAGYELPLDEIFETLKNSRRRETLRYLRENGGETTLSDVAEHIAALENDTTIRAISSAQRKRVYVGLYQCHLPKMDDTDVIDFEQNRGTIEIGPNAEQLYPYLEEPETEEWHKLYTGVAVAGFALFVVAEAGAASFGLTPTVVLLWLLVGMTVSVVTHYLSSEK